MRNNLSLLISLMIIAAIVVAGCTQVPPNQVQPNQPGTNNPVTPGNSLAASNLSVTEGHAATQGLLKFSDQNALENFLAQTSTSAVTYGRSSGLMESAVMDKAVSAPSAAPAVAGEAASNTASGSGASDYSHTNVQVAGVDEADFVKNDARYIYMIADNKLVIVDAADGNAAAIVSTTKLAEESSDYYSPNAKELFVNGDKVMVFVEASEKAFYFQKYDVNPIGTYRQKTYVYIYDVSDRSKPVMMTNYSIPGAYYQSRMIGDIVYAVTQEGMSPPYVDWPVIQKEGATAVKPEMYYFDNPEQDYQLNIITSIKLSDNSVVDSKSFLLGYANTLMVSENNIYIAYQKQNYWCFRWWGCQETGYEQERFYQVIVPLLKGDLKTGVETAIASGGTEDEKWNRISSALAAFYEKAAADENYRSQYDQMLKDMQSAITEYDTKKALEDTKTIIHKIGISNGQIDYQAKGEVYGSLLNQFSLDEYNGNLRVATTVNIWSGESVRYNNVYVLNSGMQQVGKIENIAPGESIYSTRFLGDRLYMVTFRQVDPFFVVDLSSPTNPKILGQLKITGFSDYLHPYDATHIIGIGKETGTNEWGGVNTKGLKIALFDVSDVANPKQVDMVEIGLAGSDSAALYDHKAFLFSKTKNLLVLPVTEITSRTSMGMYNYNYGVWHGAYVFKVTTSGFTKLGTVRHSSADESYFDWWNSATVSRSLYMDNVLYTISNKYIKANDLSNNLELLKSIDLPYTENTYYRYY